MLEFGLGRNRTGWSTGGTVLVIFSFFKNTIAEKNFVLAQVQFLKDLAISASSLSTFKPRFPGNYNGR